MPGAGPGRGEGVGDRAYSYLACFCVLGSGPLPGAGHAPGLVAREGERTPRAAIYLNFRKFLVQYIKTCYMKRRGHALFVFLSSDEGIRVWLFSIAWVVHRVGQLEMLLRASALS